jgi:hypothetical protein
MNVLDECWLNLLTDEKGRLCATAVKQPILPEIDITLSYNDDFKPIHEIILKRLNTKDDKGIIMLHGISGSGKTSYIRYLMSLVRKKMLYVPADYAHYIGTKEFMTFLLSFTNGILIIEDAEDVIKTRGEYGAASATANLLNLSDGLLSDALNIQVIVTFNTDLKNIDSALLRRGRMIARYEFKALEQSKAQRLSDKLGFDTIIESDSTLAEIYNQNEIDFSNHKKNNIGFANKN